MRSSGHLKSKSIFLSFIFLLNFLNVGTNVSFHGKRKIDDHVTDRKKMSRPTSDQPAKKQKASLAPASESTSASPDLDIIVIDSDLESPSSSSAITTTPSLSLSAPQEDISLPVCYYILIIRFLLYIHFQVNHDSEASHNPDSVLEKVLDPIEPPISSTLDLNINSIGNGQLDPVSTTVLCQIDFSHKFEAKFWL